MSDVSVSPDQPYRLAGPEAMDAWRQGTPMPQPGGGGAGASALGPQSPLAAMGPPPAPTAGAPPQGRLNVPPMPQQPQLQQNKEPPPDQKEYQKNAMGWAEAFAVLGALAGRFTRAPGGAALGAFGAALKGWQTGNLQAYQTAADQWEKQSKQALDNNKLVLEKYKLALEDRRMNIDEQMQQIQLTAANYHDKIMYDAAASKNYTLVAQAYEKGWRATDKGYEFHAELSADNQEIRQKAEQTGAYWLTPEGQQRLQALPPTQQAAVKQLIDIYASKAVKGGETGRLVSMENQERAARGEGPMNAQEELDFVAKSNQAAHPPRSAPAMAVDAFKKDFQAKNGRPPNGEEITKFAANYSGEQAYGRTAGGMGARAESATNEVTLLIPQAVEASRSYLRGNVVSFNKIKNAIEQGVSDPAFNDFESANFGLINAYARAMNPQGVPRITERLEAHAIGLLSTAISPQAYETQIRRLWKEVQASKTATAKTAEGRSPGDINAPVPGLDDAPSFSDRFTGAPASNDGWTVKEK